MTPFEDLIRELGNEMNLDLHPDTHLSCLLAFPAEELSVQIDLDSSGDQILVGSELGNVPPGAYREKIFLQAMRVNGGSLSPRGILAFSEKNNTLVLFQFLQLASLNGEKLHTFLEIFCQHAKVWKEALKRAEIPEIEEEAPKSGGSMFGLQP
ncbi:MAG: CesT family type III secretion system chaperone [Chlamydiales bacterium]|nr:CesT family type III secretion system chaperone [Chlamydiales bacterium]